MYVYVSLIHQCCDETYLATLSIHRLITAKEVYFRGSVFLLCGSLKSRGIKMSARHSAKSVLRVNWQ